MVKSAEGVRTVIAKLTSGVSRGTKATIRCRPAALEKRAFGSEGAAPPMAPVPASSNPEGTVNENPSKVSVYTEEDGDVLGAVGVAMSSAAKEGRAKRAAVVAAKLPRAMRREEEEEEDSGLVGAARPADRNNLGIFRLISGVVKVGYAARSVHMFKF